MKTSEQRIHDAERIKAKRQHDHYTGTNTARVPKLYRTPTPCSCWMCGNPRKFLGERTVQERRAMQEVEE
jgi:hypothetical protein